MKKLSSCKLAEEMSSLMFAAGRLLRERSTHLPGQPLWTFPLAYAETIRFIAFNEPVTMKELADYLHIKPPSATALIKQMIKIKLVVRHHDPDDRRTVYVKISPFGRKIMRERMKTSLKVVSDFFSCLSKNERTELVKILSKVVNNFRHIKNSKCKC